MELAPAVLLACVSLKGRSVGIVRLRTKGHGVCLFRVSLKTNELHSSSFESVRDLAARVMQLKQEIVIGAFRSGKYLSRATGMSIWIYFFTKFHRKLQRLIPNSLQIQ
jgi:hypothetical protein